jgi:hypothetical protein
MQTVDQVFPGSGGGNKSPRKLGCAFALLPISAMIMLAVSLWYGYSSYQFVSSGIEVEGTVVRLESSNSSDSGISYSPVFRYTVNGQEYEYESVNSSNPPTHAVGDSTTLLYQPDNPAKARENSFWELWLMPAILFPISIGMLLLSIVIPFLVRLMPQ